MFFDLGLRPADYHKPEVVRDTILDLDDKFTVVLIFEYLDESLVLLKRKLCWDLDDVLYLKFHYLSKEKGARKHIHENQTEQIRQWNRADVMLYEHFNTTLWEYIRREGDPFYEDLNDFRTKQKATEKDCLGNYTSAASTYNVIVNPDVSAFNRYLCEKLVFDDIQYLNYFRKKVANERIRGSLTNSFEQHALESSSKLTLISDDSIK